MQLYCVCRPEETTKWNNARPKETAYPPDIHENLITRLEEPDSRNRWDSPLFSLIAEDSIPDSLLVAILEAPKLRPNDSTQAKPLADTNYLNEQDVVLKSVADAVLEAVRNGFQGGEVKVPGTTATVTLPSKGIGVSEMGRLRRLYAANLNRYEIKLTDREKMAKGFVEYINANMR
jgi:protein KTI12